MDIIQDAIDHNKHVSKYDFIHEQTWDTFRARAVGKDIYLYGLGNAARYFIEAYSEKIKLCGVIDSCLKLQGFCIGDYLPEAVETSYDRVPIFDASILETLPSEKSLILISNINAYEEIARRISSYKIECFVLLLMEADQRLRTPHTGRDKQTTSEQPGQQIAANQAGYRSMHDDQGGRLSDGKREYADRCCRLPVKKNKIVCMIGKYGGHARVITNALIRKNVTSNDRDGKACELDIVWLVTDLRTDVPEGVRPVLIRNWKKYIYEMETAGIWVFDIVVPDYICKRKGQIYIQTKHWSSITLKKFYLDDPSTTGAGQEKELVKYNGRIMDYILVGSDFDMNTCKSGFACDGVFVRVGSPRTDAVFDGNNRDKVYARYHIAADTHTVLYAPTFRYNREEKKKRAVQGLDYVRLPEKLQQRFGGKWKVLFRGHPSFPGNRADAGGSGDVIDVSGHDDSQELVAACDLLLSDYSSIMFEAAFAGKTVLLFAPDQKEYIGRERELYIDYKDLPFPAAETNEELWECIGNFREDVYRRNVDCFMQKYGVHEDGHAGERAAEFMMELIMRKPVISVIIPVYNTAAYLPRCIESVINQTYRNLEIILVDDGSTDDSRRICEVYAKNDPRIVLVSQENRGNTAARKAGLRTATGEYVMFVDSDDWIGSSLVSQLYQQAERHHAEFVISDVCMIRVGGREEARRNLIAAGVYTNPKTAVKKLFFDYEDCRYGILPYVYAKLYRRDLAVGAMEQIDDRIQYDEDRALVWTCLMQDITVVFTDCMEYDYCQRAEGLVRARDEMYLAKINYFYCYMRRLFEKEDEILEKQLEQYVIWNVRIALKWKLGMSGNALAEAEEVYGADFGGQLDEAVRPVLAESGIKVSIIIPSLNAARYIRQCLDSVRTQTLPEIEILCVDAGSEDGTIDIIKEYAALDHRIRYLAAERRSYGYQMNLGVEAAQGEYIGIVEPDDYVSEEMFEKLYDAARGNRLDYVKSDFYKFMDYRGRRHYQRWERSSWGKHPDMFHRVIAMKETPHALVYGDHGNIWSGIYRREFLLDRQIRFHETPGASYQDTGFALLCTLEAERVMFVKDCFYRYRQSSTGTSVRSQDKHSAIITEYAWIWEQMKSRGFTDEVSRSYYMAMKFHSYRWNYDRLRTAGRNCFLDNLARDAILPFREESIDYQIPGKDRMLRLWQGDREEEVTRSEREESRRRNKEVLLGALEKASRIVVVSAGAWGASLLKLYGRLGALDVCTVCDNSAAVQGRTVAGMEVVSVERAVREHPDDYYMIANKRHAEEIHEQLRGLGVAAQKICICKEEAYKGSKIVDFLLN